jgi:hypothetical protein
VAVTVDSVLRALENLRIPVRGPFVTPKGLCFYVVDSSILIPSELVELHAAGKFTAENVPGTLRDLKRLQEAHLPPCELLKKADLPNRRRSQRVLVQIPVLFLGQTADGAPVQGQAFTQVVNAHGGLLDAPVQMSAGQDLTLVNPQSGKQARCRIIRVGRPSDGCFPTAFEFEERSPHFWPITFPPPDWGTAGTETNESPTRSSS